MEQSGLGWVYRLNSGKAAKPGKKALGFLAPYLYDLPKNGFREITQGTNGVTTRGPVGIPLLASVSLISKNWRRHCPNIGLAFFHLQTGSEMKVFTTLPLVCLAGCSVRFDI